MPVLSYSAMATAIWQPCSVVPVPYVVQHPPPPHIDLTLSPPVLAVRQGKQGCFPCRTGPAGSEHILGSWSSHTLTQLQLDSWYAGVIETKWWSSVL
jgi:hypothetical protein